MSERCRYKTELCEFIFRTHGCYWGDRCNHAHSIQEKREAVADWEREWTCTTLANGKYDWHTVKRESRWSSCWQSDDGSWGTPWGSDEWSRDNGNWRADWTADADWTAADALPTLDNNVISELFNELDTTKTRHLTGHELFFVAMLMGYPHGQSRWDRIYRGIVRGFSS